MVMVRREREGDTASLLPVGALSRRMR